MKKILSLIALVICAFVLFGCSEKQKDMDDEPVRVEVTLDSSKEELANIKDSICNSEGKVKYISGEIVSELKPITISMKNGDTGNIEDTSVEVYDFRFVTMDNKSHNIFLKVDHIGNNKEYKPGDSVYYDLKEGLNSAWYIGENQEVLYLVVCE